MLDSQIQNFAFWPAGLNVEKFLIDLFFFSFSDLVKKRGLIKVDGSWVLPAARDINIECSKQFKWNLNFYGSGQSGPFWAEL